LTFIKIFDILYIKGKLKIKREKGVKNIWKKQK